MASAKLLVAQAAYTVVVVAVKVFVMPAGTDVDAVASYSVVVKVVVA